MIKANNYVKHPGKHKNDNICTLSWENLSDSALMPSGRDAHLLTYNCIMKYLIDSNVHIV